MKIGLACDLKNSMSVDSSQPDDALEEYDSPETVQGLTAALEAAGHSVILLGGGREFLTRVLQEKVDFVFNIAEGRGTYRSREAQVPSVLEMLNIPYSGADPECLAVCLDKPLTKKIAALESIPTPRWQLVETTQQLATIDWQDFPLPVFIKPAFEGSSKGIRLASRITRANEISPVVSKLLEHYHQAVLVEEFIAGDEITVGMLGNTPPQAIGIMRVLPRQKSDHFIYSLEVKRDWEKLVDYECPAKLPKKVLDQLTEYSVKAFEILGCRDFGRVDFRVAADGTPYFLEINPLAGLNPHSSDLPIMVGKLGWNYQKLISCILNAALKRYGLCSQQ